MEFRYNHLSSSRMPREKSLSPNLVNIYPLEFPTLLEVLQIISYDGVRSILKTENNSSLKRVLIKWYLDKLSAFFVKICS